MTVIKMVCAWCGDDMGEKEGGGVEGVSHGVCEKCEIKFKRGDFEPSEEKEMDMVEDGPIELKRAPGTCCPEPECDKFSCHGCEYLGFCLGDPQKVDYCPRPHKCSSCGADCTKCELWLAPVYAAQPDEVVHVTTKVPPDFSKMTEGEALYSLGMRATEKDGKKGLNMPIPGKPGETLFIPASDEEPGAIVASEHKESRVKGAKKTRCADCRRKVWISPSTQVMRKRYPKVPVICISCFVKRAEQESKEKKEA